MKWLVDTTYRSKDKEIMDDFSMGGDLLRDTLNKLGRINKWLGGNSVTINGIKRVLNNTPKQNEISIVDLGCGHGDMLRLVADFGRKRNYKFNLIGIDANKDAINYAKTLSEDYHEISYKNIDIFSEEFKGENYDIVLATLFLHHFNEKEIKQLLTVLSNNSNLGIVINDLHRHRLAYYLFKLLSVTITNTMIKQDGLTSILRAFKRKELKAFANELNLRSEIYWKWAFRYQWLILK